MQNRYDWTCYAGRIKKRSIFVSFLFHISFFSLLFLPIHQKNKNFEKEIVVVKLVNIPMTMPEIIEKNEIKIEEKVLPPLKKEGKIKSMKDVKVESMKDIRFEKKAEFSERFSPDEYKKKLYSKISTLDQQYHKTSSDSQNVKTSENIKIPEIKSIKINAPSFDTSRSNAPSFDTSTFQSYFSTDIPSWYINLIKKKIEENWVLKEYLIEMSSIVSFRLYRDGRIENISIEKSSGYKKFDNSIIEAIKSVKTWPAFPTEIKDKYIDIMIEFKTEG
jgi:TonB family protein